MEPSAFTKVSTLGVEEQRVNIIADFAEASGSLGDGYRVEGADCGLGREECAEGAVGGAVSVQ